MLPVGAIFIISFTMGCCIVLNWEWLTKLVTKGDPSNDSQKVKKFVVYYSRIDKLCH